MSNSPKVSEFLAQIQYQLAEVSSDFYYEPNTSENREKLQSELQRVLDENIAEVGLNIDYLKVRVEQETDARVAVYFDESPVH